MKLRYIFLSLFFLLSNLSAKDYVLTVESPTLSEAAGTYPLNIRVEPKLSPGDVITIGYTTQDGTAVGGSDYQSLSSSATINNSFNGPQSTEFYVPVTIIDDLVPSEGDESFNFIITNATVNNANSVSVNTVGGLITIVDNDTSLLPTLSISDVTIAEDGGSADFTVSLSTISLNFVTFTYATLDGSATGDSDYTISSGSVTIEPGETSATISIPILNDSQAGESYETFSVFIDNATNATISDAEGIGTIQDDDTGLTASINDASIAEGDSGTNTVNVNIIFSEALASDITFDYITSDGTANSPADYQGVALTSATVPAGSTEYTLSFTIVGDTDTETAENFYVTISNMSGGYFISDEIGRVTIFDNDSTGSCSSYVGLMTINEYQNNPHYFDLNNIKIQGNYVEVKYIDFLVKQFITDDWSLSVYTTSGVQTILWLDKDPSCVDPRYDVFQFDNSVMAAQGYVVLKDQNGNEVDVLNIYDSDHYAQQCQDFVYDTDFTSSAQNKDLFRDPDGTGDWFDTGAGANSLGSRCINVGGSPSELIYTDFDAIDTDETVPNPIINAASVPIKTKIVNNAFDLRILSLDVTTGLLTNRDIIIKAYLTDTNGNKLDSGQYVNFNGSNSIIMSGLISNTALKEAKIYFEYCGDDTGAYEDWDECYGLLGDPLNQRHSYSRNTFAIRPDSFSSTLTPETIVKAKEPHNMSFYAYDASAAATINYNETQSTSFEVDLNITDIAKVCPVSDYNLGPSAVFVDGEATSDYSFDHVGVFELLIHEIGGAEFANVDVDDTPLASRLITPWSTTVTVIPDHFDIGINSYDNNNEDNNFTYLSDGKDDFGMMSTLDFSITAQANDNTVAQNYTELCYAQNVDLNLTHSTVPSQLTTIVTRLQPKFGATIPTEVDLNVTDASQPIAFDLAKQVPLTYFSNGAADLELLINFNRQTDQAVNPFKFTLNDLTAVDDNGTTTLAPSQNIDESVNFVYGRVHAPRYRAMCDGSPCTANVTYFYELYADQDANATLITTLLGANRQRSVDSVNWYRNTVHETENDGNVTMTTQNIPGVLTQLVFTHATQTSSSSYSYDGNNGFPYKGTISIPEKTPLTSGVDSWLIYDQYNAAAPQVQSAIEYYGPGKWTSSGPLETKSISDADKAKKNTNRRIRW